MLSSRQCGHRFFFPLFAETRTLSGVGPKVEKLIARVAGTRLIDLVFDLPAGIIDRSYRPKLKDAQEGRIATVEVTVGDHLPSRDPRRPYKVRCADDTAFIELDIFPRQRRLSDTRAACGRASNCQRTDRTLSRRSSNGSSGPHCRTGGASTNSR